MNDKERFCLEKLIEKIQLHQDLAGDTSSDTETETSLATAHSFTSGSSSQVTSPRSSLLWDHGYDIAEQSIDEYKDKRECEWRKFNVTDDDKLTADKHAAKDEPTLHKPSEHICDDDLSANPAEVESAMNFLPDLLAGTDQVKMADSPTYVECQADDPVGEAKRLEDSPPPLPASSPPTLISSESNSDKDTAIKVDEKHADIKKEIDTNIIEDLAEKFQDLLDFDQHTVMGASIVSPTNSTVTSIHNIDKREDEDDNVSHSGSTDLSDDEDMKNDIEEEFEAILHAFDLNFGQDTYVERFAGRRDKYGFILSPVVEAPSPTPSSLSGYSGISSTSPDPFSVFRMSPAPRGARLDLDLSSLGMSPRELDDHDQTVPIYQTVQAKRAIVIPEGYGWDSGDDLLSPTGSGEWDSYENGLSSPPVSASGITVSHLAAHILGWKNPQDAIIEESESETDTDTVEDDSSSAYASYSTVDGEAINAHSASKEKVDVNSSDLHDENLEITTLTDNFEDSFRNTSPYEVLKANQKNISLYLDKPDKKRPDSEQSLLTTDGSSNSSDDEDAEDEYSDSEDGNEDNIDEIFKIKINNVPIENLDKNAESDANVQVTEMLTPRTAILLSGGMYPESSSESDTDDYLEDMLDSRPGLEAEPERDSNMSSYGSGILVTQYTSCDSEDEQSDYQNGRNLIAQSNDTNSDKNTQRKISLLKVHSPLDFTFIDLKSESSQSKHNDYQIERKTITKNTDTKVLETADSNEKNMSPIKIHSPLDFTFLDSKCESPQFKQDETRSPRVFGRHYAEFEKYILDEASPKNAAPSISNESDNTNAYVKEPFYLGLSPEPRQWMELADSFTNIEFKKAKNDMMNDSYPKEERSLVTTKSQTTIPEKNVAIHKVEKLIDADVTSQTKTQTNKPRIDSEKGSPNPENIKTHKAVESTNDLHKETKASHQPIPVKIQVSHLSRKGSFTNKVKKGYVHQLSELFQQKEAETTHDPVPLKKASPSLKKEPEVIETPKMILPKENVVISDKANEFRSNERSLQNTLELANESLGFEVTNLQRVDSFEDIETHSNHVHETKPSEKYEDDFESDTTESSSDKSDDNNLKLYENRLRDTSDSESVNSDTSDINEIHAPDEDINNDDDDIQEEIEGRVDIESDNSEDEELFMKIHACDPKISKKLGPIDEANKSRNLLHIPVKSLSPSGNDISTHEFRNKYIQNVHQRVKLYPQAAPSASTVGKVTLEPIKRSEENNDRRYDYKEVPSMKSNRSVNNNVATSLQESKDEYSKKFSKEFFPSSSTNKHADMREEASSFTDNVSSTLVQRHQTLDQRRINVADNSGHTIQNTSSDDGKKNMHRRESSLKRQDSVDLGGIFWSQNLDRYKPVESTKYSHKTAGVDTTAKSCESSLFDIFSRLQPDKDLKRKNSDSRQISNDQDKNQSPTFKKRKTDSPASPANSRKEDYSAICNTRTGSQDLPNGHSPLRNEIIVKDMKQNEKEDISRRKTKAVKGEENIEEMLENIQLSKSEESEYDAHYMRDKESNTHYPYSFSKQLSGSYSMFHNIKQPEVERGTTPPSLLQHSGLVVTHCDDKAVPNENTYRVSTSPNDEYKHDGISMVECNKVLSTYENHRHLEPSCTQPTNCHVMSNTTASNHSALSIFEYPPGDSRNRYFRHFKSRKTSQLIDEESRLNYDPADQFIENIDGRIIYPEVFEYSCYNVKTPVLSPAQRESLNPLQSRPINYCNSIENQRGNGDDILFSNSNRSPKVVKNDASDDKQQFDFSMPERCNDSRQAAISPVNVESNALNNCNLPNVSKQLCVHADITEGGLHSTAVKNDFFHEELGVCLPKEISNVVTLRGKGDMRNDMQTNDTNQRQPLAVSAQGINGLSLRQTDTIYHQHMSEGDVFTYDDHDADRNVLEGRGGGTSATVLIQTLDGEHVLEDEKGQLKIWPYSDFEDSRRKLPVTLHRGKKKIKLFIKKTGMSQPPSNMTVIQTAQLSTEMPENKTMEKYHSSAVLPENRNTGELMQTHGESVQSVLFKDTNGNMLTEEELSAILPRIADSISKMKEVDAEEILPGITQSVTKLQNGGNLVITTMTRKLDGEESDESGRGSPIQHHPVMNVDDLDNNKIFFVQDSKGELFYVEDITSDSQESAYFSSRNTSESVSDGGYSPAHGISQIKQVGRSNIRDATAEEILSAMYDQDGIQEITENEEEWSERTYEYDRPRQRNANPRQSYSKNDFKQSYVVEEPETLPRGKAVSHQDRFESSYQISGSVPWVYDGGVSQSYSQATQGQDEMDSASAISGNAAGGYTRTTERLTVEAETDLYPVVPVANPPVPYVPPLAVQTDTPQYSLVKVDVTANKQEPVSPKLDLPEQSKSIEAEDRPIYKTVAHIHTRDKQPSVKTEMAESKKYRIISSKATETNEEEQETRMSLNEVDYKFSAENVEYKASPSVQHTNYYFRNATHLETPKRYKTERKLELNNSSDQKYKSEIQVLNNNDHKVVEENNFYRFDEMKSQMEHTDTSMRVVRGSYLIKNNLEEIDGSLDDNINMFDGDFTLCKDNPLYQSDEDLYRRYEREKNELAQKQQHFQRNVNQDISFETVDRYSKSKTVQRDERPKQSLSELLLSRLSSVDSKDIRQKIDVKHHSEDIYGDPRFLHADGTSGEASYSSRSDFDTVGEKVDLLIKDGKAFIAVIVTAERIVPLDMEFNVWRKNQAIVTRTIEVDLLATEQRRRLYYKVMEEPVGGGRGSYRSGPNETVLDSKRTLELFTKILGAADGEGDKEDITVKTRSGRTTRPFTSGMDLLY